MNHLILSFVVFELFFRLRSQINNIDSRTRQHYEVFLLGQHKTFYGRLPQLKALMPAERRPILMLAGHIQNPDFVSVNVYCFKTDYQFFIGHVIDGTRNDLHVGIANIHFVCPGGKENVVMRIILFEFDDIKAKLAMLFVTKEIKDVCFRVVGNILHQVDAIELI